MKKNKCLLLSLVLCFFGLSRAAASDIAFSTNLVYLVLTAMGSSSDNLMMIVPVETHIGIHPHLTLMPVVNIVSFGDGDSSGVMTVLECGLQYFPFTADMKGFNIAVLPGIGFTIGETGFGGSLSFETGYQHVFGRHFLLGLSAGYRWFFLGDINFSIPDIKLRTGFKL